MRAKGDESHWPMICALSLIKLHGMVTELYENWDESILAIRSIHQQHEG